MTATELTPALLDELEQSLQCAFDRIYDSLHSDIFEIVRDFADDNDLDPDELMDLVSDPYIKIIRN